MAAALKLSRHTIPRIDIVSEFLWGRRLNKDGRRGEARQLHRRHLPVLSG